MSRTDALQADDPAILGGVVAYLTVDGAVRASQFYQRALAAREVACLPVDDKGRTMHVHLYINGGSVMLSDAYPEQDHPLAPPQGFTLMLPVDDVRAWFTRAVEAGCEVVTPPAKMFWGATYGEVRDPFGVVWAMNQEAP